MPAPYHVNYSGAILNEVKKLYVQARNWGIEQAYVQALQKVQSELQNRPLDFGDPSFTLRFTNIKIRHQIVSPILVYWGVHEESSTVFLKSIELWPGQAEQDDI